MLIFEDLLRRTVGNQMALAHYVGALTHRQRFTNVVVRDQYAKPAVAQVFNDTFDIDNGDGVNARKRFIQQDKFRVCCQRARNLNAAAFTTGQRLTEAVAKVFNMKLFHQLVRTVSALLAGQIVTDLEHGHQVVEHA